MAPEQIQACIEACTRSAEAGEAYVRVLTEGGESAPAKQTWKMVSDAVSMCKVTASTLMQVSAASKSCCQACVELCEIAARACSPDTREESAQCERALVHCATECRRLAGGLPEAHYLA